mmetsp:Transcript_15838/g.18216  ORF Transcript_15838/g.18216 Transcript_15838/m.18216 type:complete len:117 (+) Transcript_15838:72-422(+)
MTLGIVPKIGKAIQASNLPGPVKAAICHPVGPLTIFFWAPMAKWGLVLANLNELRKPPETIMIKQQVVMILTGLVWARWATIITPVNYSLMAVNLFVAGTGLYQVGRKWQSGTMSD